MRNIKVVIEYDGTHFCGWQWQPQEHVRTVQRELIGSLRKFLNEDVNIIAAGRTDSGVHALGQVFNFKTQSQLEPRRMVAAMNGTLPKDVRAVTAEDVPLDFNARFNAKKREYHYSISRRERAIGRQYSWCYLGKLNVDHIREASQYLLGECDCRSFCKASAAVAHHLTNIERIEWEEVNDYLILKVVANRFLHNMIRIIVGTMIEVGTGLISPVQFKKIVEDKDRRSAGYTAPAKGLCLVRVYY